LREARDQFGIDETGDEDSVRTRFCGTRVLFDSMHPSMSVVVLGGWFLEDTSVRGVDEETNTRCFGRARSGSKALELIDRLAEFFRSSEAVFEVTANRAWLRWQSNRFGDTPGASP